MSLAETHLVSYSLWCDVCLCFVYVSKGWLPNVNIIIIITEGGGMRSLCFFYKILWLIGPQSATKHSPWLALLIAISQEILSVSKWMEIWFYCELVLCLFAKDLTLYDQNCRTKSIVELSNSRLGTWIPPEFILCWILSWILPIIEIPS